MNKLKNIILKKFKRSMDSNDINYEELKTLVDKGAVLIDVRSPQEYNEGHLLGAICIPEYEIANRYKIELKNKDENIVLYCSSGWRSKKAQNRLKKLGYTNVYNLYNGIEKY